MTFRVSKIALIAAACLTLSACGEGWVPQLTTDVFPYGNQRTAGSGVIYVRANLMPPKADMAGLDEVKRILAPVEINRAPNEIKAKSTPQHTPAPILKADDIFTDSTHK